MKFLALLFLSLSRQTFARLLLLVVIAALTLNGFFPDDATSQGRPNFLVIVTDDQNAADLDGVMPLTLDKLFDQGIRFNKGYVTTPWCCPSRATIFTGLYAHNHGVTGNTLPLRKKTIIQTFSEHGYYTGIVGKYLNSSDGKPRPEFNFWRVFPGGNAAYVNPRFNEDGLWAKKEGHIVRVMETYLLDFIERASQQPNPFLLYWTPNIPHRPAIPEKQYAARFASFSTPRLQSEGCGGRSEKPKYVKDVECSDEVAALRDERRRRSNFHRRQLQTLLSVDDVVNAMLSSLEQKQLLGNTVVVFLSDNGILRGSFGLQGKVYPYEDAVKVPFGIRYDAMITPGQVSDLLVANIDIAPTFYELAQVTPPYPLDGRSLVPLFQGNPEEWRETLLLEAFTERGRRRPFVAITDGTFTLIINKQEILELYNLVEDPQQLRNLYRRETEKTKSLFALAAEKRPEIRSTRWLNRAMREFMGIDAAL